MNFATLYQAAMIKRAAAILTPEAEQAAVQPPQDPSMMGGDPSMAGGGMSAQGPNGGMIPPEITQDQQFLQWLQAQGVQFDPASGQFLGPDGQPIPAEAIMQAYQQYQAEMQGQMPTQGGAPEQGGMPQDPAMAAGGMPPQDPAMMGGAPMDPAMQGGQTPIDPAMQGQMPPQGGGLPPEILQDQMFMQFMTDPNGGLGVQFDPNSGTFIDPQSGQPIPPDMVMQAYQAFQQQQGGAQGADPSAQIGQPPMDPAMMGGAPEQGGMPPQAGLPPEMLDSLQSMIDSAIQNYTAQIDKKLETLIDKLDTVKMALESQRDTDDKRAKEDKDEARAIQDEIAAELQPTIGKQASASRQKPQTRKPAIKPINMFDLLRGK